jgi:hypothetical protein
MGWDRMGRDGTERDVAEVQDGARPGVGCDGCGSECTRIGELGGWLS